MTNITTYPSLHGIQKVFSSNNTIYAYNEYQTFDRVTYFLWKLDPATGEFTPVDGFSSNDSNLLKEVIEVEDRAYFTVQNKTTGSVALWTIDPATQNPISLTPKDAYGNDAFNVRSMAEAGGILYFNATEITGELGLWKLDNLGNRVKVPNAQPYEFRSLNDTIYFNSSSAETGYQQRLYRINSAGVGEVIDIPGLQAHPSISSLSAANGVTYFSPTRNELWKIDSNSTQAIRLPSPSGLTDFTLVPWGKSAFSINNTSYLTVLSNGNRNNDLLKIDSSTGQISSIASFAGSIVDVVKADDQTVYFTVNNSLALNLTIELWKIGADGESSQIILDSGDPGIQANPRNLQVIDGKLYFTTTTVATGRELWTIDPAVGNPSLVADLLPGNNDSSVTIVGNENGKIFLNSLDETGAFKASSFGLVTNTNQAPLVSDSIADQTITIEDTISYTIPNGTFFDPDGNNLTYSATLNDGKPLPTWLSFNADTKTFSGKPSVDSKNIIISVQAADPAGLSVTDEFNLSINHYPVVVNAIASQSINEKAAFSFTIPDNTFTDPDTGDTLTFKATLADNSPLPRWLTFDPATRTFTGTPAQENIGKLALKVIATDRQGAEVSNEFPLEVINVNEAPVIGNLFYGDPKELSTIANQNFRATLEQNTSDPDGDPLTFSATLADGNPLPNWLTFNPTSLGFSGTPTSQDIGQLNLRVTATDLGGLSDSKDFALIVKSDRPAVKIDSAFGLNKIFEGTDNFVWVKLVRDGNIAAPLTVKYSLGGTAKAGSDYSTDLTYTQTAFNTKENAVNNTVTFAAGYKEMTVAIPILDDNINEGTTPETIIFNLESDAAYDLVSDASQRSIQLVDSEVPPVISFSTPGMELDQGSAWKLGVSEGNYGEKRTIEFTAKMSVAKNEPVSVDYAIEDITTNNSDYTPVKDTITFAPGETEKKVSIQVTGDSQFEPDEKFKVVFSNPRTDVLISDPAGSGKQVNFNITIANDDQQPTVTIAATKNASETGAIGEFVITRDDVGLNDSLTVKLETSQGADFTTIYQATATLGKLNVPLATPGEDYATALPTSVTFAPGENKITLPVKAIDDAIIEDNQPIDLRIVSDSTYTQGNVNAAVKIIDDEIVPRLPELAEKTAAEAGYKISKLSTAAGVTSIPGNYQIFDGNKVVWLEGKDLWFFDGQEKKQLDRDIVGSIELSESGIAWTKNTAIPYQHLFFFDGSTTLDLGRAKTPDGAKTFNMTGDRIAYYDDGQISIYNTTTKKTTSLPAGGLFEISGLQLDPLGKSMVWYENPDVYGGSYYNELKFYDGNSIKTVARTNDANGARKAVVSGGKVLYSTNVYTNNRTDLYLYDGEKNIKLAEGVENSTANLNSFGIDGDRVYYQVILDSTNNNGESKPTTALRNYYISTGKTETIVETSESGFPFVNQLAESASNGEYTAWNYLGNSATVVNSGIYLNNGTNNISIKDPEPGEGRNEFRPVVAADGNLVFAVYDGKNNRSDLYLVSKDTQVTPTNQAPIVANAIADQNTTIGSVFSFAIPGNAFTDSDTSDTLSYTATLADGKNLPAWLSFDNETKTFTGTPPTGASNLNLRVKATDNDGLGVTDDFKLTIYESMTGADSDDRLTGNSKFNEIIGLVGNDRISGLGGSDRLFGGDGYDVLRGGTQSDQLFGEAGSDRLIGGYGADLLKGGTENDRLMGGNGDDELVGGKGDDLLIGDEGADIFVLQSHHGLDTISDFKVGEDRLELSTNFTDSLGLSESDGNTIISIVGEQGEKAITLLQGVTDTSLASLGLGIK